MRGSLRCHTKKGCLRHAETVLHDNHLTSLGLQAVSPQFTVFSAFCSTVQGRIERVARHADIGAPTVRPAPSGQFASRTADRRRTAWRQASPYLMLRSPSDRGNMA